MLQALKHPWLQDDETIKKVEELWQGQKLLPSVANGSDQVWVELSFTAGDGYPILDLDSFGVSDLFCAEEYLSLSESLHHLAKMAGFNPTFFHNSQIILRKKLLRWTVLLRFHSTSQLTSFSI